MTFLPYQRAWLEDPSRVRIAEKSRRVGFSWVSAAESALEGARSNGSDTWYVGYNHDMAQEYIRDVAHWARALDSIAAEVSEEIFPDDDPEKRILAYVIRFAHWRVTALSSRPTNLRGKKGRIVIDEAAFHDNLGELLKSALAVLMWGGSSRVDIISTHNGVDCEYNRILEEVKAGKRPYSRHRVTLDDALEQGLYRRICEVNGAAWTPEAEQAWRAQLFEEYGDAADEELLCIPAKSGGTYLRADLIEATMRPGPVLRMSLDDSFASGSEVARKAHVAEWCRANLDPLIAKLPADRLHYLGVDFGRVSDRSVLAPSYRAQDLTVVVPFVVELHNVPFDQQREVAFYLLDRLPRFEHAALDATGNGAYLAEVCWQRYGEKRVERVDLSEKWYGENLPAFKAAIEDGTIQLVRDADHLIDLQQLKVINGIPKLPKAKTQSVTGGAPRHGDAAIAYVLSHFAAKLPVAEFDYKPARQVTPTPGARINWLRQPTSNLDDRQPSTNRLGLRSRPGGIL